MSTGPSGVSTLVNMEDRCRILDGYIILLGGFLIIFSSLIRWSSEANYFNLVIIRDILGMWLEGDSTMEACPGPKADVCSLKVLIKSNITGDQGRVGGWDVAQPAFTALCNSNVNAAYGAFRGIAAVTDGASALRILLAAPFGTNPYNDRAEENSEFLQERFAAMEYFKWGG